MIGTALGTWGLGDQGPGKGDLGSGGPGIWGLEVCVRGARICGDPVLGQWYLKKWEEGGLELVRSEVKGPGKGVGSSA